jgi:hypothetical protein
MLFLMLSVPALAVDLTGMFDLGGFAGYGFGFGDAFDDYTGEGWTESTSLGFAFGACGSYHFNQNMGVIAFFDWQSQKCECTEDIGGETETTDETENWMVLSGNFAYYLMPDGNTMPYFMGGPGVYIPSVEGADTEFGFNFGAGVLHFVQPNLAVNAGARFHYIAVGGSDEEDASDVDTSDSITYIGLFLGATFYFGGTE